MGTWTPTIDLDGTLSISFRADTSMNYGLNMPGTFSGTILNREYIGKSSADLIAKWNEANPDDQAGTD